MIVHFPLLLLALALLWLPRSWMRYGFSVWRGKRRALSHSWTHAPQDGTVLSAGHEFSKTRNYLDFVRATVGSALLVGAFGLPMALSAVPGMPEGRDLVVVRLAAMLLAVLIQTLRWERRRLSLSAPVFFIAGLLVGVGAPIAGLGAFALAWACVPIFPNTQGFLTLQAGIYVLAAYAMGTLSIVALAAAAFGWAPVLLSLLSRRPLMVFSRKHLSSSRSSRSSRHS